MAHETAAYRPLYRVWCGSEGRVSVPLNLEAGPNTEVWLGALHPGTLQQRRRETRGRVGYGYRRVPFDVVEGSLQVEVDDDLAGHWLYVVRRK